MFLFILGFTRLVVPRIVRLARDLRFSPCCKMRRCRFLFALSTLPSLKPCSIYCLSDLYLFCSSTSCFILIRRFLFCCCSVLLLMWPPPVKAVSTHFVDKERERRRLFPHFSDLSLSFIAHSLRGLVYECALYKMHTLQRRTRVYARLSLSFSLRCTSVCTWFFLVWLSLSCGSLSCGSHMQLASRLFCRSSCLSLGYLTPSSQPYIKF